MRFWLKSLNPPLEKFSKWSQALECLRISKKLAFKHKIIHVYFPALIIIRLKCNFRF